MVNLYIINTKEGDFMEIGEIIGKVIIYCIVGAMPTLLIMALIDMLKKNQTKEAKDYLVGLICSGCILGMMATIPSENYVLAGFLLVVMFGIIAYADHK